jgi:hypothetical protein
MMQLLGQSEIKKEKLIERTKANMTTYVRQSEDKHNLSSRNANKKNISLLKKNITTMLLISSVNPKLR